MTASVPELVPYGESIRIPQARDVRVTERVRAVIDHPDFQRLRRVRQLGPTHLVYPGAVHTRFEHSIGAYGAVQRFVTSLLRNPTFASSARENDILAVLAGGLCHDIGHYPFAHSLEALHRRGRETPRHEDLAGLLIRRGIGDILKRSWGVDPERVIRLIQWKREQHTDPLDRVLSSVLSSAIDADKMDYLERDSAHLGVPYGQSFDASRLIGSLTLNEREDALAIHAKGKIPAEMFIFSRYMMFSEAYWHHTVRAASVMVEGALADHVTRLQPDVDVLTEHLLRMGDDEFLVSIRGDAPDDSVAARLLHWMTGDQRLLYKRLTTYSRVYQEEEKRAAYERLYALEGDGLDEVMKAIGERLGTLCGIAVRPGDVLVDTPPRDKDHPETVDVCYSGVRGKKSYPLHELSGVVAGVHRDFVQVVKKIRVFVSPELAKRARTMQHRVEEAILEVVLA